MIYVIPLHPFAKILTPMERSNSLTKNKSMLIIKDEMKMNRYNFFFHCIESASPRSRRADSTDSFDSLSLFLATCPYQPAHLLSSLHGIQFPHRSGEFSFLLVGLH